MSQFYEPYLASIPYGSSGQVWATPVSDANDLALPLSIVWIGTISAEGSCGGADVKKAILLLSAIIASGLVHFISQITGFENWNLGKLIGMPVYMNSRWYISLMTVGVAFIAGRGGFCFIIGGFACYWVLAPLLKLLNILPASETLQTPQTNMPEYLRISLFRPVGIGMLVGRALTGIVFVLPLITSAVRRMQKAARAHFTPNWGS